jgi:hypothetical protein
MLEHGLEEWSCTECSRKLLLRRPPEFEQIVLERGDEWIAHSGGAGGLQPAQFTTRAVSLSSPSESERGWLADHGIAWGPSGNSA